MQLGSAGRQCASILQASTSRTALMTPFPSIHNHIRSFSEVSEATSSSSYNHGSRLPHRSPANPINLDAVDAVEYLRKIFPPLEFPLEVAQRMTTHISWERGVKGHNTRLGFVGRRVLHTYLLLFLHECTLAPPSHTPARAAPIPPSGRLRPSSLNAGGFIAPLTQSYDDISEKLFNTYTLGEHVGAAWQLERVMRWTPAVAELDVLKSKSPDTVLRSSGLYKVRGATVEGVVGGIFHQFGGSVAHRVFHTRVLPHVYKLGLPPSLHSKMREACERFGGEHGLVRSTEARRRTRNQQEGRDIELDDDRPRSKTSRISSDADFAKVGRVQERRRSD